MKLSSDRAAGVGTELDSVVVPLDHNAINKFCW